MAKSTQSNGIWYDGIVVVRIAFGALLVFDGWKLFEQHDLGLLAELIFNMSIPFPEAMTHTAKILELAGGFFLILGLFTRLMTLLLIATFMTITFVIGEGRILSDDQLPFLYSLLCLTFFFSGAGRISIDYILFVNRKEDNEDSIGTKGFGRYVSRP